MERGDKVRVLKSEYYNRLASYKAGDIGYISGAYKMNKEQEEPHFYDVTFGDTSYGFNPNEVEFVEKRNEEFYNQGGFDRKNRWFPRPENLLDVGTKILYAVFNPTIKEEYSICESVITSNASMNNAGFNYMISPDPFIPRGEGETYRGGSGGGYKHSRELNKTRVSDYNNKISYATLISTNLNKKQVMTQLKKEVKEFCKIQKKRLSKLYNH